MGAGHPLNALTRSPAATCLIMPTRFIPTAALFISIGTAAFVISALVRIPATWAVQQAPWAQLRLVGATGTLWNGEAEIVDASPIPSRLLWRLYPTGWFSSEAAVAELRLEDGQGTALKATLTDLRATGLSGHARGQFAGARLTGVLSAWGARIDGLFTADGAVQFTVRQGGLHSAEGQLRWTGGHLSHHDGRNWQRFPLPPLRAEASTVNHTVRVQVRPQDGESLLLEATITPEQQLSLQVQPALQRLLGLPSSRAPLTLRMQLGT